MRWPFRKRAAPRLQRTPNNRWTEIQRQGNIIMERLEIELINLDTGERRWVPQVDALLVLYGGTGYLERVRSLKHTARETKP